MSKAVMISIQPKWCELIASGKKTIEVRKTRPKLETPFKCYIYETKEKHYEGIGTVRVDGTTTYHYLHQCGRIVGEFVCDYITPFRPRALVCDSEMCKLSQVPVGKLVEYAPDKPFHNDHIYGWHISNLVIYDKSKELSEFKKHNRKCHYEHLGLATPKCSECSECQLERPPQSWCYVEEMRNAND